MKTETKLLWSFDMKFWVTIASCKIRKKISMIVSLIFRLIKYFNYLLKNIYKFSLHVPKNPKGKPGILNIL